MKIKIKRLDDAYHLEATNEDGRTAETDGSPSIGGSDKAMRPMQMLLSSLGTCSGIDVINFLKKFRQPLEDLQMELTGEREPDKTPSLFTDINIHYILYGDLEPSRVEKAIVMSVEKYCSVAKMIENTANITWSYEIKKK